MHGLPMIVLGVALLAGCQPAVAPAAVPASSGQEAQAVPPPRAEPSPELQQAAPAPPGALRAVLALTRHHWRLASAVDVGGSRIDALFVRPQLPLQLDFNASLVSVGNACNVMSARHAPTADSLSVEPFSAAMTPCADPALGRLDGEVAKRLQGRLAMRFEEGEPPRLVLVNAAGDVFTFDGVDDARVAPAGG